jgi:PAS domain S-box-containing protein
VDVGHLIENAGLLILGLLVHSYVGRWLPAYRSERRLARRLLLGALFGLLTVAMMIQRIELRQDLFVDARWVPVALAGLFEGPIAGLLAAGLGAAYRVWLGGPGLLPGVGALLATGALAGLVHRAAGDALRVTWRHQLALSAGVYLVVGAAHVAAGPYGIGLFARVWWSHLLAIVIGIGLLGRLFRDEVEREHLLEERTRFRAVLDEASDAIRIVEPATLRIVEANLRDAELAGRPRGELIGRRLDTLWPEDPAVRQAHEAFVREVLERGEGSMDALPHPLPGGGQGYLAGTGRVVRYGGRPFAVFLFRDATDRVRAERAEREAEALRAVTELARATAHEINNPLQALLGNLELVRTEGLNESERPKWIQVAVEMGLRIRDIVGRLMRITRREVDRSLPGMPMLDIRKSSDPDR